tara:strand:+ start:1023 stop:2228 length:1206 start_codon:yes stop_codon:yes gene_type:complete
MIRTDLILNESKDHKTLIQEHLRGATKFVCLMAFAKESGYRQIEKPLAERLKKGMTARIAVGLDFYQSDASVLLKLFKLSQTYNNKLELLIEGPQKQRGLTFHPKIYAFETQGKSVIIIGSANLTSGGLSNNYEASVITQEDGSRLIPKIDAYLDELKRRKELEVATSKKIKEYDERATHYKILMTAAKRRFTEITSANLPVTESLKNILQEMRRRTDENSFDSQIERREKMHRAAKRELNALINAKISSKVTFLRYFDSLRGCWHSGGLDRGKTIIAKKYILFQNTLKRLPKIAPLETEDAFNQLKIDFEKVPRAGINLMTELLGTLDNSKFAVMNRNSIRGVNLCSTLKFPETPSKTNITGAEYKRFCEMANSIKKDLNLKNLSELDAVFNYLYWRKDL